MTYSLEPSHFSSSDSAASSRSHSESPWHWRLEDSAGNEVANAEAAGQRFPSQSDAESWVGEVWEDLLEDGVEAVTLFEAEREIYGPMGLRPST